MASCTACTVLSIFLPVTPSAIAAFATATAEVADEARRFSTAGSSPAPGSLTSTWPATASAAAGSTPAGALGRAGDDRAEAKPRVDQGVVRLPEGVGRPVVLEWPDRQAGGDQRPPLGPGGDVGWDGLGPWG